MGFLRTGGRGGVALSIVATLGTSVSRRAFRSSDRGRASNTRSLSYYGSFVTFSGRSSGHSGGFSRGGDRGRRASRGQGGPFCSVTLGP